MSEGQSATTVPAGGESGSSGDASTGSQAAGQAAAEAWYGSDATLAELVKAKGWGGPADVLKGYRELEGKLGQRAPALPSPEDAEAYAAWDGWKALGVPDDPSGYKLNAPKLPDGMQLDTELQDAVLNKLHRVLPQPVAQQLIDTFGEVASARFEAARQAEAAEREALLKTLKSEWDKDFEARQARAQQTFRTLFEGETEALAGLEQVVGSASLLRMLDRLGGMMGEDRLLADPGGGGANTKDAIEAEIATLRKGETGKAYMDRSHPDHAKVKAKIDALYKRLEPLLGDDDEDLA